MNLEGNLSLVPIPYSSNNDKIGSQDEHRHKSAKHGTAKFGLTANVPINNNNNNNFVPIQTNNNNNNNNNSNFAPIPAFYMIPSHNNNNDKDKVNIIPPNLIKQVNVLFINKKQLKNDLNLCKKNLNDLLRLREGAEFPRNINNMFNNIFPFNNSSLTISNKDQLIADTNIKINNNKINILNDSIELKEKEIDFLNKELLLYDLEGLLNKLLEFLPSNINIDNNSNYNTMLNDIKIQLNVLLTNKLKKEENDELLFNLNLQLNNKNNINNNNMEIDSALRMAENQSLAFAANNNNSELDNNNNKKINAKINKKKTQFKVNDIETLTNIIKNIIKSNPDINNTRSPSLNNNIVSPSLINCNNLSAPVRYPSPYPGVNLLN